MYHNIEEIYYQREKELALEQNGVGWTWWNKFQIWLTNAIDKIIISIRKLISDKKDIWLPVGVFNEFLETVDLYDPEVCKLDELEEIDRRCDGLLNIAKEEFQNKESELIAFVKEWKDHENLNELRIAGMATYDYSNPKMINSILNSIYAFKKTITSWKFASDLGDYSDLYRNASMMVCKKFISLYEYFLSAGTDICKYKKNFRMF